MGDKDPPRPPGIWIPYAILGTLISVVVFVITFIGSVRVMDHRLLGVEDRIRFIEQRLDLAQTERHQLENRITRLESRQGEK